MVKKKGNRTRASQAFPLYAAATGQNNIFNLPQQKDPNKEDERKRILRDAYWKTLEEYVKLDDLKFPKDQKMVVMVLELDCGEALEARTLCAYLKRGKNRLEEVNNFLYYGIENDQQAIKTAKQNYEKNNPQQHSLVTTKLFNFEEQIPDYLPEMAVLTLNNLNIKKRLECEWKTLIQEGMACLRKGGILIATLNYTGDAPAFRQIIGNECDIHRDRKNIFAPKEYPETYDHIIVGRKR